MITIIASQDYFTNVTNKEITYLREEFISYKRFVTPTINQSVFSLEEEAENIVLTFRASRDSSKCPQGEQVCVCLRPALSYYVIDYLKSLGFTVWVPRLFSTIIHVLNSQKTITINTFEGYERV